MRIAMGPLLRDDGGDREKCVGSGRDPPLCERKRGHPGIEWVTRVGSGRVEKRKRPTSHAAAFPAFPHALPLPVSR